LTCSNEDSSNKKFAKVIKRAIPYPTFDIPEAEKPQRTLATFTTERNHGKKTTIDISRKQSIVREKCRQLSEIALNLFPDRRVPDQDLGDLIQRYIGADRETIRAYKGYYGSVRRSKRTGEGYVVGNTRKGYLEIFDFMHRINRNEWVIHAQMKLPNADLEHHNNEGVEFESKEKISLSQRGSDNTLESGVTERVIEDRKYNNNNNTERERNFTPKISPKISKQSSESEQIYTSEQKES